MRHAILPKDLILAVRCRYDPVMYAIVAQLVERHLAKVEIAGSSPVYRFWKPTVMSAFSCAKFAAKSLKILLHM